MDTHTAIGVAAARGVPRYEVRWCACEWSVYDGDDPTPVYSSSSHDECDRVCASLNASDDGGWGMATPYTDTYRALLLREVPHPASV